MTNSFKKRIQSSFSIFNIFALTFQSFMPGFFALVPVKAYAQEVQEVTNVDLEFSQESNEFGFSAVSDADVEYVLSYQGTADDSQGGVKGIATVIDGTATATEYAGTCSTDEVCTPKEVISGNLELPNADFTTDFVVDADTVWFTQDNSATVPSVVLGTIYSAPQNDQVQVVFTKLPENPGSLTIEEITLSDEQVEKIGAYSNIAYDVTSNMPNGTFEYELKLPLPEGADDTAGMAYAESVEELTDGKAVAVESDSVVESKVVATGLDHFTVFVVTKDATANCPGGVYSAGVCYETIQNAINAADPSDGIDTVEVFAGTYTENLTINKSVILKGANYNLNPNTDSRVSESVIIGQVSVTSSDVEIYGFKISNPSHSAVSTIKGIHLYKNGSYISNIKIENNLIEDIHNLSTKGSYGIMIQGAINNVSFINNKINNLSSSGWTHAIEVTPSGGGPELPTNIIITGNTISNITNASGLDQYAFSVDWVSSTPLFADASEITFSNNNLLGGQVRNLDSLHTLNAKNNNWGVTTYQEIEDRVDHNCAQWKVNSGLSGLTCDSILDPSYIGIVDYSNPIGTSKNIAFTNIGTPTIGGTNPTIALTVEAIYLPYGVERVRFRYAPQGQTCQQQYTSPYFNDLGDGVKNGDLYSVNWDVTGLSSGTYTVCALMHRGSGMSSEGYKAANHAEFQVIVDNSGPVAPTITTPTAEQYFNSTPILNDWTDVTDPSGISKYRIKYIYDDNHTFSGAPYRETTISQRNHTPGISEQGGVTIWVQAFDGLGNEGAWSQSVHYIYDATAPEAPTLTSPANEAYVTGNPTQTWSAVSGAHHYIYESYLDAGLTTPAYTTSVSGTSRTVGGMQTIGFWWRVKAVDAAGNESPWSDAWKLNVDNTAPAAPTGLRRLAANDHNIVFECGATAQIQSMHPDWDDIVGDDSFSHYEYSSFNAPSGAIGINEQRFDESIFEYNGSWLPNEGTYGFAVRAVDKAGNKSAWSLSGETLAGSCQITYDNTAPTVDLVFPTPGTSATNFQAVFSENVIESEAENPANYFLNNWPGAGGSGDLVGDATIVYDAPSKTATITFTNPGWYISPEQQWGVQNIHDLANNLQQVNPYEEYSTPMVAPVTVDSGTDSSWHTSSVTVNFSCTDISGSGCKTTYYTTDGTDPTTVSSTGNSVTISSDGVHTVKYFSVDNAGNVESVKTTANTVKIDTINPISEITTFDLEDGGEVETAVFDGLIQGTATDEPTEIASGVTEVLLEIMHTPFGESEGSFWNGSDWQPTTATVSATGTTNWEYQIPEESVLEGTYTIESHAVDAAGNVESTYTITIVYDRTIPEVSLTIDPATPDAQNGWYKTNPTVTLTANDNYSVDYIEYQWNSTAGAWTTYSSPINPPGEGQNVLYYRSVDTVGNVSDIGVKEVKYDATAPTEGPLNVRVENVGSTTADGKWQKPNGADYVHEYRLSWKHENGTEHSATVSSETYEHKLDNLFDGLWEFRVTAADAAGHTISAATKFRVGPEPSSDSGSVLGVTTDEGTGTGGSFIGSQNSSNTENSQDSQESESNEEKDGSSQTDESGAVLGDTDNSCATWKFYLPLFLLLIQVLFAVSLEIANRELNAKKLLFALAISGLLMGAFYMLRDTSCFEGTGIMQSLAKWFVPVSVGLAFLLRGIGSMTVEEK